ncbi:MAG: TIR domain-containing protein, partial [Acidobacteria bacterium]|nr:TIR domain-containing protein [Acidobacteriota bacterium]
MPSEQNPPKVFISYSHDSQEHFDRILLLSDTLREWGIDCHIDQYELAPADWVRWMERRIRKADFVLIVCTATYRRRFDGEEEPGKGLGVRHEGGVISAELYNRQTETAKFIPVIFSLTDNAHIPSVMQ